MGVRKIYHFRIVFFCTCLFIFLMNCLFPLSYGDDYVYSFLWDGANGWNMYLDLPENARRVGSFGDIFISQWSHYFTWGGRIPAHVLVQFFLWQGKWLFNIFNTAIFMFLLLLLYWMSLGGRITWKLKAERFLFLFFAVWAFCPDFSVVTLWLTGSCNYLWMLVLLFVFLTFYVRSYFLLPLPMGKLFAVFMFFLGILAGWTNENTVCWLVLLLPAYCYQMRKQGRLSAWMVCGVLGMLFGFSLMMLAPGNQARYLFELSMGAMTGEKLFRHGMVNISVVFIFEFFLWHYLLGFWRQRKIFSSLPSWSLWKNYMLLCCAFSLLSLFVMLLSPSFPLRSSFPSVISLILAAAVSMQVQEEAGRNIHGDSVHKLLHFAAGGYLFLTMTFSVYGGSILHAYTEAVDRQALQAACGENRELVIGSYEMPCNAVILSGFHLVEIRLSEDKEDWHNTSYARFWGLDSVSVRK